MFAKLGGIPGLRAICEMCQTRLDCLRLNILVFLMCSSFPFFSRFFLFFSPLYPAGNTPSPGPAREGRPRYGQQPRGRGGWRRRWGGGWGAVRRQQPTGHPTGEVQRWWWAQGEGGTWGRRWRRGDVPGKQPGEWVGIDVVWGHSLVLGRRRHAMVVRASLWATRMLCYSCVVGFAPVV